MLFLYYKFIYLYIDQPIIRATPLITDIWAFKSIYHILDGLFIVSEASFINMKIYLNKTTGTNHSI